MQIHELNKRPVNEAIVGPGGFIDTIKNTAKTLAKPGGVRALAQATPKDTAGFIQSDWMDMYRQSQADRATQSWIDGLLKQYKMQAGKLPVPAAATPTPTSTAPASTVQAPKVEPEQPMYLGGKKLDPKNPKDAELITKLKAQGLTEATNLSPEQFAQQFQTWSDEYLNTRLVNMDQVRNSSIGPKMPLPTLLGKLSQAHARGDQKQFDELFKQYMNVATAGIRTLTQQAKQTNPQTQQTSQQQYTTAPGAMDIRQQLQTVGISNQQLLKLGQLVMASNDGQVRSTGNPAVDDVLRNMGIKI